MPFRPFSITTRDGRIFRVPNTDRVALGPPGVTTVSVGSGSGVHILESDEILAIHEEQDVSSEALIHAQHMGYRRGFDKGNRMGGIYGFILGALAASAAWFWYYMWFLGSRFR